MGRLSLSLLTVFALSGCSLLPAIGPAAEETATSPPGDRYPDVLAVELRPTGARVYDVSVTISSPYDSPARYADCWRVLGPSGVVLGTHTLLHDHASEQPFTRTQRALSIPAGIEQVTVEGRDQLYGFGGQTVTVDVPG